MENDIAKESEDRAQYVVDLYDKLTSMTEYKVVQRLKSLEMSKYVYQSNYAELKKLLTNYTAINEVLGMPEADRKMRMTANLFEITRLLHNFVTSVRSHIEHTRVLHSELCQKTGKFPEYQPEVKRHFINNPLVQFVEGLRDFCLRFEAPPVRSALSWSRVNAILNTTIQLDKKELSKYKKWTPVARKYMAAQDDVIELSLILDKYNAVVVDFCNWIQSRFKEVYASEIALVDSMQKEIQSLLEKEYSKY